MTEAMISGSLLHNDTLDGNAEKMKHLGSKSLPTFNKNHIFDGLDVSFIERDILNRSARCLKSTRFVDSNAVSRGNHHVARSLAASPFGDRIPKTNEMDMQKKFREFEKDQHFQVSLTQLRRHPPPLKLRSLETPTSYNEFLTLESEPPKPKPRTPLPEITISSIKMSADLEHLENFPDLNIVREHVERVRELLGRKEPEQGLETLRRRTSERRGLSRTGGDRRGLLSRRVRTVGPEVLGSWDRAGSALSIRQGLN